MHMEALKPNSTWLVTSRHDTTRFTCRARRDERAEPCCSTSATAKMHGLDTSNVSCRVETWRVKWNLGLNVCWV